MTILIPIIWCLIGIPSLLWWMSRHQDLKGRDTLMGVVLGGLLGPFIWCAIAMVELITSDKVIIPKRRP